ncbi:hypothetical protein ACOSP7_025120 [Xanthoceras sorbifolium]|uniref:Smr domain-containing protein n=1 Tax=Xanthoceras sorbifolium TaxID=99658 RepID=A0ABQ8H7J3_9ROSI|nr:hypothetical protein JRO89_XS13G0099900 [Xanthoceras sorbifolium]
MKHAAATNKRKKKRSRAAAAKQPTADVDRSRDRQREEEEEQIKIIIKSLTDAFGSSVSVEEAALAYREANGDANKAAEILTALSENSEDPSTTSSIVSGSSGLDVASSSGSSVEYFDMCGHVQNSASGNGKKGWSRQKKTVAVSGTVSNVLGKEYARASPKTAAKVRVFDRNGFNKEEVEQFLYSMLGDECELNIAVVRDVLCQCGYNVEKAMEVLLDLFSPSNEQCGNGNDDFNYKEETRLERCDNWTDRASDCTSQSSETDFYDGIWSTGYSRNYLKVLTSSEVPPPSSPTGESDLPQKVLDSLFNISKSPEHEPNTMNWRNVVKKLQSLGPQFDVPSIITEAQQETCAKGDEYQVFRKGANQHWDSMKSSYQKATEAYSKGKREYAAYLSDQGKTQTRLARVADEKASHDIFKARNKGIENVITIDLHGQHVKPAMKLFKLHLVLGSYVPSVQTLRVITGCGTHGVGKSKLKQSVIKLLEKESIQWSEENRGTVLIKLDGYREFSFLESESDSE